MDKKDSKADQILPTNTNEMTVECNILSTVCRPFRRIFSVFINFFRNTCTDSSDSRRMPRSIFHQWFSRLRNLFRRKSRSNVYEINTYPHLTLPKIDIKHEYDMNHEKRGIAVIFNQQHFEETTGHSKSPRDGTDVDLAELIKTFEILDFQVMHYSDLKINELIQRLRKVSKMDHSKNDCLVIVVLSHGDLNKIYSRDDGYHISLITSFFTDQNCPALKDKPKLFFIQACRGNNYDYGYHLQYSTNDRLRRVHNGSYEDVDVTAYGVIRPFYEPEMVHNPPNNPDFLIVRSTMPNHVSFRNTLYGSWFIQDLCTELRENGNQLDLLTLLTFVNYRVALRESNTNKGKQVICTSSMLTKRLIFHPKYNKLHQL